MYYIIIVVRHDYFNVPDRRIFLFLFVIYLYLFIFYFSYNNIMINEVPRLIYTRIIINPF